MITEPPMAVALFMDVWANSKNDRYSLDWVAVWRKCLEVQTQLTNESIKIDMENKQEQYKKAWEKCNGDHRIVKHTTDWCEKCGGTQDAPGKPYMPRWDIL